MNPEITEKPILFEVFTNSDEESRALEVMQSVESSGKIKTKQFAKQFVKQKLGVKGVKTIKKLIS